MTRTASRQISHVEPLGPSPRLAGRSPVMRRTPSFTPPTAVGLLRSIRIRHQSSTAIPAWSGWPGTPTHHLADREQHP